MAEMTPELLEQVIRKVVAEQLGKTVAKPACNFDKHVDPSGVSVVRGKSVRPQKFDTGKPGDHVYLVDLFDLDESPRLGAGIMEMKESAFDWTLNYDEVDYIIEGTLEIIIDGRKVIGHAGDIILIPKGSTIQFSSPGFSRFMYVVYPANWEATCK